MSNQNIDVSGEGNTVRVFGSGSLHIGNQSIDVSGEGNSVVVASDGDLHIGDNVQNRTCPARPPKVKRGQVWQHNIMARRFQVISVRGGVARCLVTDVNDKPITHQGQALIQDVTVINMRYAWQLIEEAR